MAKKKSITLTPTIHNLDGSRYPYRVKKTVNLLSPRVGAKLTEDEAQALIDDKTIEVTVTLA